MIICPHCKQRIRIVRVKGKDRLCPKCGGKVNAAR